MVNRLVHGLFIFFISDIDFSKSVFRHLNNGLSNDSAAIFVMLNGKFSSFDKF